MLIHTIEYYDEEETKKKSEYWCLNGGYHREDGPAYIQYWENGEVEFEGWWANDERHRENGPAIIRHRENGEVEYEGWWINNKRLSDEEIEERKLSIEADKCIEELLC